MSRLNITVFVLFLTINVSCQSVNDEGEVPPRNTSELIRALLNDGAIAPIEFSENVYHFMEFKDFIFDSSYIEKKCIDTTIWLFRISSPNDYRKKGVALGIENFPLTYFFINDISDSIDFNFKYEDDLIAIFGFIECSRFNYNYKNIVVILNKETKNIDGFRFLSSNRFLAGDEFETLDVLGYYHLEDGNVLISTQYSSLLNENFIPKLPLRIVLEKKEDAFVFRKTEQTDLIELESIF